ncbi:MAG TPA: FGGY family carbohydrate kinase [Solirubrobacteraceae bacterium]|nr:FGGY family carbohydrate kinase [Solirubrobacteraceae bacterium]
MRAAAALSPKDFVSYRLTGELATDTTTPTRSLLNDWRSGGWSDELCAGVSPEILRRCGTTRGRRGPCSISGPRSSGLRAGTVLAGVGGDDPSAVLGCGVTEPGELSIGSSSSTSWRWWPPARPSAPTAR